MMSFAYSSVSLPGISFPPPSTLSSLGWRVYSTHSPWGTRTSPLPHQCSERWQSQGQAGGQPSRNKSPPVVGWGRLLFTLSGFFPLDSTTSTCPSTMDPHTTEGKQDGLLSQQISEMTESLCVSVHSTTSQFCDFGLLNVPVMSAFKIMVCIRTWVGIEFLIFWNWEFLYWTQWIRGTWPHA